MMNINMNALNFKSHSDQNTAFGYICGVLKYGYSQQSLPGSAALGTPEAGRRECQVRALGWQR